MAQGGYPWLVALCAGAFLAFLPSIIFENQVFKAFQVGALFVIGGTMVFQNDDASYIGIIILSLGWMYLYTYGFMAHGMVIETVTGVTALVTILAISTEGKLSSIILRTLMTAVIFIAIWINARTLIEKAREADALRLENLELKLRLMEATLGQVVEAGMVLVDVVKAKGKDNASKG